MTKKIKRKITEEVLPDWEEEKKEEEIDYEDSEMESIAKSLPGGVRCISIYRMHKAGLGGRPKFIAEIPPEQFRESVIQEMYGGGSYFGRWTKKDGTTIRYSFDIEGPEKTFTEPEKEKEEERMIDVVPVQQPGMDTAQILRLIQETRKEAREEMRMLLELMRPQAQSPDTTAQVFNLVEKIVPLIQSGGDGGSPWLMALSQFKEPILKLVDAIGTAASKPNVPVAPPQITPIRQPVQQSPVQPVPQSQPTQPTEHDMLQVLIRQYLPIFVNAAAKNADPDLYADMVLDQVPQTMYPKLKEWLENPAYLEDIAKIEPGVRFQADWWISLRSSILMAMIETNATSGVQPGTPSGQPQED